MIGSLLEVLVVLYCVVFVVLVVSVDVLLGVELVWVEIEGLWVLFWLMDCVDK